MVGQEALLHPYRRMPPYYSKDTMVWSGRGCYYYCAPIGALCFGTEWYYFETKLKLQTPDEERRSLGWKTKRYK